MDDGLQNPTLEKTCSLLVIDGRTGFGNGRVLPAGPLREPVAAAASRCQAAVLIGPDITGALRLLPASLPVLRADLVQDPGVAAFAGRRAVAFAGIAHPGKFFDPLREAGVVLVAAHPFSDHHRYREAELSRLLHEAQEHGAVLLTTPKDAVRLPEAVREQVSVIGVGLRWQEPKQIDQLLENVVAAGALAVR